MSNKILIPYKPRKHWQGSTGLHNRLNNHRFSVIVAHRRFGKTIGVINHLIKQAVLFEGNDGRFAYIAPFKNQAKNIAWDYLKKFTGVIPNIVYSESELMANLPNGSRIRLFGADNAESLRGLYFDGLVIDEIADIKPEVWGEILRPTLSDRKGWCVFIGTPRGQNIFFELYQKALSTDDWFAATFRADKSGILDKKELESLKEQLTENQYRQEMLCDFTAATDDSLIGLDIVIEAQSRNYKQDDIRHAPIIFGLDVARFGGDDSVLTVRQGLVCLKQSRYKDKDNMTLASLVASEIEKYKPDAVFIDAGRGEGVIDRLRQLGFIVMEVNFGAKPINTRYANKRAEMWALMAQWLKSGQIMQDQKLAQELTLPTYSFDAANRLLLESKQKMKERCSFSPDGADSLALTFAMPVVKNLDIGKAHCNTDFNPLKEMFKNAK